MILRNVTTTGGEMACAIVGLPPAPVASVVLQNVKLRGKTRLSVG
jgi:hypothetical protein